MTHLLDTNVCAAYLRGKKPLVRQRFALHPSANLVLCSVVVAELFYGAGKGVTPVAGKRQVEGFIASYISLPFDDVAARVHATVRLDLESRGLPIGDNDYLIAAIALAHNLILVTHNTREFARVPGLALEDWELP